MQPRLSEFLSAASRHGIVSASVIPHAGGEPPQTVWVPASSDEPTFLAYSITKTIVATLVLKLCEEGRMQLDDRLARWFPRVARAESITVRQVLNHTAGIPDYGGIAAYHAGVRATPSVPWTFARFAAETFERGLAFEPGHGWLYSNPGYMLLRRIVEEVAGASFRDVVRERIVDPLGLGRTCVPQSVEDLASLAPALSRALTSDAAPREVRECYHPGWVSHGVVASTASELVRFLDGLFRGRLLSTTSLRHMMEFVPVPGIEPDRHRGRPGYGLGLMGDPESPWGLIAGHNGGGPGYSSSAFHAVDLHGASVCVMAATEDVRAEEIVFDILDALAREANRAVPSARAPESAGLMPVPVIRSETAVDVAPIREVTQRAFADRWYSAGTEQDIIEALRNQHALTVSLVADDDGAIVGHVAFSPASPEDGAPGWYTLGPVSVIPERQRRGIGQALINAGIAALRKRGAAGCIVVGDTNYYSRFGFINAPELAPAADLREHFMILALGSAAPECTVHFHKVFGGDV